MVENSKLESRAEVEISKLKVEITRLKQRALKAKSDRRLKKIAYMREYRRKLKALKAKNEYRRLKKTAYMREYRRKLKARGGLGPEGACRQLAASGA